MTATPETRVVPVMPTKEMFKAAFENLVPANDALACWLAMLAAAPAAPAPDPVGYIHRHPDHSPEIRLGKWPTLHPADIEDGWTEHPVYAAPVAASPEAKPAPAVKALEWKRGADGFHASTKFGDYFFSVDALTAGGQTNLWPPGGIVVDEADVHPSINAAKAAAQSDYDRRVRACLVEGEVCVSNPGADEAQAVLPITDGWRPIEEAPKCKAMFVAIAIDAKLPTGQKYTSDPWVVWTDGTGFARWPHDFQPTHFMPLPCPRATGVE